MSESLLQPAIRHCTDFPFPLRPINFDLTKSIAAIKPSTLYLMMSLLERADEEEAGEEDEEDDTADDEEAGDEEEEEGDKEEEACNARRPASA